MASGPEHYRKAEEYLQLAKRNDVQDPWELLAYAQVHAQLAQTAALAELDVYSGGVRGMSSATGRSDDEAQAWGKALAPGKA